MDYKKIKEVSTELKKASKMHEGQANKLDSMLKMRNAPLPGMVKSPLKCWSGYKRVPGTKEFSKGSCVKK